MLSHNTWKIKKLYHNTLKKLNIQSLIYKSTRLWFEFELRREDKHKFSTTHF